MIKDYYVNIPPHLSDVLADLAGVDPDAEFSEIISAGRPLLFNFSYNVPQAEKEKLENFILDYYITRRIGSGNVKKWRQYFKAKLTEIMYYYGDILESALIEFEPILNNDLTTTDNAADTLDTTRDKTTDNDDEYSKNIQENGTYSKTGSESSHNTEINRFSDTPQGDSSRIWEIDAQGNPSLSDIYLTDVRGITDNGGRTYTESGTDAKTTAETGTDERDITEHETVDTDTTHQNTNLKLGVSGTSKSKLLNEYRETFLRTYEDITRELEPLFYNLVEVDDLIDFV